MDCPECHEPVPAGKAFRFCHCCGATLAGDPAGTKPPTGDAGDIPRLEVQDLRLRPDTPAVLLVRCGAGGDDCGVQQLELLFDSAGLELGEDSFKHITLDSGGERQWPLSVRGAAGSYTVHVTVHSGNVRWQGNFTLEIADDAPPSPLQIIGAQDNRQGRYVLGDNKVELTVNLPDMERVRAVKFVPVQLAVLDRADAVRIKRVFQRHPRVAMRRLSLMINTPLQLPRICLLAGKQFRLGRQRTTDLRLRCRDVKGTPSQATERISRQHASIEFRHSGATWCDRSQFGTYVISPDQSVQLLRPGQSLALRTGMQLSVANVLPLKVRVIRYRENHDLAAYRWFVEQLLGESYQEPTGPDAVVCLQRGDELDDAERYVLFEQYVYLGSEPSCAVHLPHATVAPRHALLFHLAGSFWLEPLTASYETHFDGRPVPQDHLLPLAPDHLLRLGDVEITVAEFQQRLVDY